MASRKYQIAVSNQQATHKISTRQLKTAVAEVLEGERVPEAIVSVAIVDDATIHQLNRQYLKHDYPTDVLSFVLERERRTFEGEIIISADTAAANCVRYGWSPQSELTLYAIHGTLHLIGYDDHSPTDRRQMRAKEKQYLLRAGIKPKTDA